MSSFILVLLIHFTYFFASSGKSFCCFYMFFFFLCQFGRYVLRTSKISVRRNLTNFSMKKNCSTPRSWTCFCVFDKRKGVLKVLGSDSDPFGDWMKRSRREKKGQKKKKKVQGEKPIYLGTDQYYSAKNFSNYGFFIFFLFVILFSCWWILLECFTVLLWTNLLFKISNITWLWCFEFL